MVSRLSDSKQTFVHMNSDMEAKIMTSKDPTLACSASSSESAQVVVSPKPNRSLVKSSSLLGNLMRRHSKRDPLRIYEVVKTLGEGSMGAVFEVQKKQSAVGGSARPEFVEKSKLEGKKWFGKFVHGMKKRRSARSLGGASQASRGSKSSSVAPNPHARGNESNDGLSCNSACDDEEDDSSAEETRYTRRSSTMISFGHSEQHYALKNILLCRCREQELQEELKNEVEILRQLDHINIGKIMEVYDYKERMHLVLELCSGGDLFARDPYTEEQACSIMHSLLGAVSYLHSKGIVHRDLKFENCLFENSSPSARVKIIDFGMSQKFAADKHLKGTAGTLYSMAPEALQGKAYDNRVDIWSLGVMAYMLLSSTMPFYAKDRVAMMKSILRGRPEYDDSRWDSVSKDAKIFVEVLLTRDPNLRLTAEGACMSPWIMGFAERTTKGKISGSNGTLVEAMDNVHGSLFSFGTYPTLKKLGLMVVAYQSSSAQLGYARDIFAMFPLNHTGEITSESFRKTVQTHYYFSDNECDDLFHGLDLDGSGCVRYIEFLAAALEANGSIDEERIAEAFNRIDGEDNGHISIRSLALLLGEDVPKSFLKRIITETETKHEKNLTVCYPEFLALWNMESDAQLETSREIVRTRRIESTSEQAVGVLTTPPDLSASDDNLLRPTASDEEEDDPDFFVPESDDYLMPIAEEEEVVTGASFFKQHKAESLRSLRSLREAWNVDHVSDIPQSISVPDLEALG